MLQLRAVEIGEDGIPSWQQRRGGREWSSRRNPTLADSLAYLQCQALLWQAGVLPKFLGLLFRVCLPFERLWPPAMTAWVQSSAGSMASAASAADCSLVDSPPLGLRRFLWSKSGGVRNVSDEHPNSTKRNLLRR
ncbi:unnamed protein product [Symbiodinium sp. CCMP2592]|nr:unnamed protein product [Symbiodinium sp. CCMP2592]